MNKNEISALHLIASSKGWELSDFCPERDTEPEGVSEDGVNFHPVSTHPEDWTHIWKLSKAYDGVFICFCFSGTTVSEFVSGLQREAVHYNVVQAVQEELKVFRNLQIGPSEYQRVQIKQALVKEAQDLAKEIDKTVTSLANVAIRKTIERLLSYALPSGCCEEIAQAVLEDVYNGVCEAVKGSRGELEIDDFNEDDVRLELGRVLISRLKA